MLLILYLLLVVGLQQRWVGGDSRRDECWEDEGRGGGQDRGQEGGGSEDRVGQDARLWDKDASG